MTAINNNKSNKYQKRSQTHDKKLITTYIMKKLIIVDSSVNTLFYSLVSKAMLVPLA